MNGNSVECWGVFEFAVKGQKEGNPFRDVRFGASFRRGNRELRADGFYDGDGVYKIRFMPDETGHWTFTTSSDDPSLDGLRSEFVCTAPEQGNHGPVRVAGRYHFAYADGTPYLPFGTTCYAWIHQSEERQRETLATLTQSPFNKIRMCIFPKRYAYNTADPERYPFPGDRDAGFDTERFDPLFFAKLERRIRELGTLGIEADLILFHPYDKGYFGFDRMEASRDEAYLRYVIARLSAFRNVWWSLANEYDFMSEKKKEDWDRLFAVVRENDPYGHLRSIHNGTKMYDWVSLDLYDHAKPWVDHVSLQHWDLTATDKYRREYGKPVIVDECCYEGDIPRRWGNITGEEMTHRFWEGVARGGYVGHGETYLHPDDVLWWSHGGTLHGSSPARIAFLRRVLEEAPPYLEPLPDIKDVPAIGIPGDYYLLYFGIHRPAMRSFELPEGMSFEAEWIDTWNMTMTPLEGELSGTCTVKLPGKPYHALRIRRISGEAGVR